MLKKIKKFDILRLFTSIGLAVFIWFWVMQEINPIRTETIDNIIVSFNGSKAIEDENNLIITENQFPNISVTLRGEQELLSSISATNIIATADVSDIVEPGTYEIEYNVALPFSSIELVQSRPETIEIKIDRLNTKDLVVAFEVVGTPASGYVYDTPQHYQTVSVSGPEEVLDTIVSAYVPINVTGADKNISADYPVYLIDADGKEVKSDEITVRNSVVSVSIPVEQIREVPLSVDIILGEEVYDEHIAGHEIVPEKVTIKGEPSDILGIKFIDIGDIEETNLILRQETFMFELPTIEGIEYIDAPENATVNIEYTDYTSKIYDNVDFVIDEEVLELADVLDDGFSVEIFGYGEDLSELLNIEVIPDVSILDIEGLESGTEITVEANIFLDTEKFSLRNNEYYIKLRVK